MNRSSRVKEVRVGRRTFCWVEKADYLRLLREAERSAADAVECTCASIGRGLRRDRMRAGLTQVEVARRAGIRVETLCRLERGGGNPTVATVRAICRALGKTPYWGFHAPPGLQRGK